MTKVPKKVKEEKGVDLPEVLVLCLTGQGTCAHRETGKDNTCVHMLEREDGIVLCTNKIAIAELLKGV